MARRILIGDDNEPFIRSVKRMLRGMDIDYVQTPEEVIAMAEANKYDAIVTDLEYTEGGREGFEVLEKVSGLSPILVLYSGLAGNMEIAAEAFQKGATHAVQKDDAFGLRKILMGELNV